MVATIDLVLSAHVGQNARVFADILRLHVPRGSKVADVTYGKGVFWKEVDPTLYTLLASDLKTGVDCRKLPYEDASIDSVVLDPPYMEGFFRRAVSQLAGSGSMRPFVSTTLLQTRLRAARGITLPSCRSTSRLP